MVRIESLLAARLFAAPRTSGDRLYFLSNLGGRLSLYSMRLGGSVPDPLLPPDVALQNPALLDGHSFGIFPSLGRILVMIDSDGDENYQPMLIPIEGGHPVRAFGEQLVGYRVHCLQQDAGRSLVYLGAESRTEPMQVAFRGDLSTGRLEELGRSAYGCLVGGVNTDHTKAVLIDGYGFGDHAVYLWTHGEPGRRLVYGKPLEARGAGEEVPLNAISHPCFTGEGRGLLLVTAIFRDSYGLGYLAIDRPGEIAEIAIDGVRHAGEGELVGLERIGEDRYLVEYNIDGCSWLYDGSFDLRSRRMTLDGVICGSGPISEGVLAGTHHDPQADRIALAFSTATSPTQLYTVEGSARDKVRAHTSERVLGIPPEHLAPGEDQSFASFDGRRISARLYLPSPALGFAGRRPLVYYVHGGPQSQERPNFAWFSMPLIQYLTLKGFAVFVPNARGSTGYGLTYTKQVDRDWGGQDRLDHVHAMKLLGADDRIDTSRAGIVGRSYGGYMTLTLAARHPELWGAAIDMFGPYDLLTFLERIPPTWKPYFDLILGDPVKDREFLVERSPRAHIEGMRCPLLVIQGRNDPRVVERESRDVVERLRAAGKAVEYLVFENEGHDVLKLENRIRCYEAITTFFTEHLRP